MNFLLCRFSSLAPELAVSCSCLQPRRCDRLRLCEVTGFTSGGGGDQTRVILILLRRIQIPTGYLGIQELYVYIIIIIISSTVVFLVS